jgi:hypothetical protein
MTKEELKEWIRENLILEIRYSSTWGSGMNQEVALRFNDEKHPFTVDTINIPED